MLVVNQIVVFLVQFVFAFQLVLEQRQMIGLAINLPKSLKGLPRKTVASKRRPKSWLSCLSTKVYRVWLFFLKQQSLLNPTISLGFFFFLGTLGRKLQVKKWLWIVEKGPNEAFRMHRFSNMTNESLIYIHNLQWVKKV